MDWVRIVDHVHITTRKRFGLAHPTVHTRKREEEMTRVFSNIRTQGKCSLFLKIAPIVNGFCSRKLSLVCHKLYVGTEEITFDYINLGSVDDEW